MSSSSDEDLSKFSEAADAQLFNNRLYIDNKDAAEDIVKPVAKTSLRYIDAPEENRTDLRVTPGFQKHVAFKLMKILDSSLDTDSNLQETTCKNEADSNENCSKTSSQKPDSGGVRLFGASAAFLASCNITPPPPSKRRKRGRATFMSSESEDDSSSNLSNKVSPSAPKKLAIKDETDLSEKFAACAVSSDWILNGEAVKGWAPPFKNKAPAEGKCTPDVLGFVASIKSKSKKRREKRKRKRMEEPATIDMVIEKTQKLTLKKKKRGKRGKSSNKGKKDESEQLGNATDTQESASFDQTKSSKKKKKKKKKDKRSKLEGASGDDDLHALLLKKLKKKKRRKAAAAEIDTVQAILEDEGFDSDPMNTVKNFTQKEIKEELLLLTRLKHEAKLKNVQVAEKKRCDTKECV